MSGATRALTITELMISNGKLRHRRKSDVYSGAIFLTLQVIILCLGPSLRSHASSAALSTTSESDQPLTLPEESAPAQLRDPIRLKSTISFTKALDDGLRDSPRTAAARAQLGIAKSALVQANILPNPALFIDNQYQFTYKLGASILLEPPWRIIFRRAAAKKQISQTDLEINRVLWLYRGDVRRAYFEAVIAMEMATIRRQLLDISNKLLLVAKERFAHGDVPKLDIHRAELAAIQADIQLEQAEIAVVQTVEQLNIILGKTEAFIEPLPLKDTETLFFPDLQQLPSKDKLLSEAYRNRLELKIVEQSRLVNQANLKVAYGNILPTPRFNFGGMTEDKINGPLNRRTWFFQALIDVPSLNVQQGDISKFRATVRQLDLELFSQRNIITGQVALAYRKLQIALARMKKYRDSALAVSGRITAGANLSYQMGQADITSAVTVQQENIQVQSQYLDSVLAYQLAMNELEQAIGTPLQ